MAILFGVAVGQSQNSDEVSSVYRQVLELNEGRFDDPNLILIGDTVLFPSRVGSGIEVWIADEPVNGRHDSFWVLSERYVLNEIETVPADTIQVTVRTPEKITDTEDEKSSFFSSWWWIVFIILAVAVIIYALIAHLRFLRNPNNYDPVGGNIDVMTREQSLAFVFSKYLLPGDRIVSFRTGTLRNSKNKKRLSVEMRFGDSKVRTVWINTGERVTEATIENTKGERRLLYLRNACSNGFSNGQFNHLPTGWYIEFSETEEEAQVETETTEGDGVKFVIRRPEQTEDDSAKSTKSNLGEVVEIIKALTVKENNIDISFNEKPEELNLSVKVNYKKADKKKNKKNKA